MADPVILLLSLSVRLTSGYLNDFIGCNQKVAVGQLLVFSDIYSKMMHEGVKNTWAIRDLGGYQSK